jgi:hypothetical protein
MADKPGHIRIAKADKSIRQCRSAIEGLSAKRIKIGEELGILQAQLLELDKQDASAALAAAAAEQAKADLLAELQATDCGGAFRGQGEKQSLETVACQLEAGSDDAWLPLGLPFSRADAVQLLRMLVSVVGPSQAAGPVGTSRGVGSPATGGMSAPVPPTVRAPTPAPVGPAMSARPSAAGGGSTGVDTGGNTENIFDDGLYDQFMGVLSAHHSLDEHCEVDQQRQLGAKLFALAKGGKRRLVDQQSQQSLPQDSD